MRSLSIFIAIFLCFAPFISPILAHEDEDDVFSMRDSDFLVDSLMQRRAGAQVPGPGHPFISSPQELEIDARSLMVGYVAVDGESPLVHLRFSQDGTDFEPWLEIYPEDELDIPEGARFFQIRVENSENSFDYYAHQLLERFTLTFSPSPTSRYADWQAAEQRRMATEQRRMVPLEFDIPLLLRGQANISMPLIIPRNQWKARAPKGNYTKGNPKKIIVHHSAVDFKHWKGATSVRSVQNYHMDSRGWADIGYNFVIGPEGDIYEGRPHWATGAHTVGQNSASVGICVYGDFTKGINNLTENSRKSLISLMAWLLCQYDMNQSWFYGHRNFSATSCPGDDIWRQMDSLRTSTQQYSGATIVSSNSGNNSQNPSITTTANNENPIIPSTTTVNPQNPSNPMTPITNNPSPIIIAPPAPPNNMPPSGSSLPLILFIKGR